MKSRYVYKDGEVVYAEENGQVTVGGLDNTNADFYVMPDIQPYKSMIDGSMITSRSQHREHLKVNGCIEIGNDWKHPIDNRPRLDSAKPQLIEAVQRAKEQYGTRNVERAITSALQRAYEIQRNRR